jgi:hypothetical protein
MIGIELCVDVDVVLEVLDCTCSNFNLPEVQVKKILRDNVRNIALGINKEGSNGFGF